MQVHDPPVGVTDATRRVGVVQLTSLKDLAPRQADEVGDVSHGDGDNDMATANRFSSDVSILLNNGDGTFQSAVNYAAGDSPWSVFSVDFDGDGDNDLAISN